MMCSSTSVIAMKPMAPLNVAMMISTMASRSLKSSSASSSIVARSQVRPDVPELDPVPEPETALRAEQAAHRGNRRTCFRLMM